MSDLDTSHLNDLNLTIQCIDHTSLEGKDTTESIQSLCASAISPGQNMPCVASVCVYPIWIKTAKDALIGSDVRVTSVATGFPSASTFEEVRMLETELAVASGADEIDMVISRGQMLMGNEDFVRDEIQKVRAICDQCTLKVILETGELQSADLIYRASMIAMEEGTDFIKTSTGKIHPAATLEVSKVMLQAIRDFKKQNGRMVGFKAAGGIRSATDAINYIQLVRNMVGEDWLDPRYFRFGASSLTLNVVNAIESIQEKGSFREKKSQNSAY